MKKGQFFWIIWLLIFIHTRGFPEDGGKVVSEEREQFIQQVVELTNGERAVHGLPPLKLEPNLCQATLWMVQDMARNHYFGHVDSLGRRLATRVPTFDYVNYSLLGENLAAGYRTAAQVVAAWMNSPEHRANILNPEFREIGIAFFEDPTSPHRYYWVQEFGSRYTSYPLLINREAAQTDHPLVELYIHGEGWAEQMRLSNDGITWSEWEPYQPIKQWILPSGVGLRLVYVQLRNGSTLFTASDAIEKVRK